MRTSTHQLILNEDKHTFRMMCLLFSVNIVLFLGEYPDLIALSLQRYEVVHYGLLDPFCHFIMQNVLLLVIV